MLDPDPILAVLALAAALAALGWLGPAFLYRWYLREVRRVKIAPRPGEAVISYPLA